MKTLKELFAEIYENNELKVLFSKAMSDHKIADFAKENGCEVTEEDVKSFLKERAENGVDLDPETLEQVSGGVELNEDNIFVVRDRLSKLIPEACSGDPSFTI